MDNSGRAMEGGLSVTGAGCLARRDPAESTFCKAGCPKPLTGAGLVAGTDRSLISGLSALGLDARRGSGSRRARGEVAPTLAAGCIWTRSPARYQEATPVR